MRFGMKYEQGMIAIVPFPFSDLSSFKQRPVLILSKSEDITRAEDVITCGITTNLKDAAHSVLINSGNLESGTLPLESRIKIDKLFTLSKSIIRKVLGKVDRETLASVRAEFQQLV